MRLRALRFFLLALLLVLSSCGDDGGPAAPGGSPGSSGTLVLTSDAFIFFEGPDETYQLKAGLQSSGGDVSEVGDVTWTSEDAGVATVDPAGLVTARGASGSTLIRGVRSGAEPVFAVVAIGELTPRARWIPSEAVESIGAGETSVVLRATDVTRTLRPGDVAVSGDRGGLLVRILDVQDAGDTVILTTEPALLTDVYRRLEINVRSPMTAGNDTGTNALERRALDCNSGGQLDFSPTGVSIRPDNEFGFAFYTSFHPDPADSNASILDGVRWTVQGRLGGKVSAGSFTAGGRGLGECKDTGPQFPLIRIPIGGAIVVGTDFRIFWGMGAEAELAVPSTFESPAYERAVEFEVVFEWNELTGFSLINEHSVVGPGATWPEDWGGTGDLEFRAKAELFAGVEFVAFLGLGWIDVVEIGFARVKGAGGLRLQNDVAVPEEHRDWEGSRKALFVGIGADLKPLFDEIQSLFTWFQRIGYKGRPFNFDPKLIDIRSDLAEVTRPTVVVEQRGDGSAFDLTATVPEDMRFFVPRVEFYWYDADAPETQRNLVDSALSDPVTGVATTTWTPPGDPEETNYLIKAVTRGSIGDFFDLGSRAVPATGALCPPGPFVNSITIAGDISGSFDTQLDRELVYDETSPDGTTRTSEVRWWGSGVFGTLEVCVEGSTWSRSTQTGDTTGVLDIVVTYTLTGADGLLIDMSGSARLDDQTPDTTMVGSWEILEGPLTGQAGTFTLEVGG